MIICVVCCGLTKIKPCSYGRNQHKSGAEFSFPIPTWNDDPHDKFCSRIETYSHEIKSLLVSDKVNLGNPKDALYQLDDLMHSFFSVGLVTWRVGIQKQESMLTYSYCY